MPLSKNRAADRTTPAACYRGAISAPLVRCMLDLLSWMAVAVVGVLGLVVVVDTLRVGAPPMPSGAAARAALVDLLPAAEGLTAHELGAGWGGLAVAVARARPTWRVVAWERALVPFLALWLRRRLVGPGNLEVRFGDLFGAPLDRADVLTCYLLPDAMAALKAALEDRGRPGAVLLSVGFGVRGWTAERTVTLRDLHRTRVMRFRVPA